MGKEILENWLNDSWQLGIGVFFGYLIVNQFWQIAVKHWNQSWHKGAMTVLLIATCSIWALSFINVTYMERLSLGFVFEDYEKPPVSFLHVMLALVFGILFAVLVSNGWRLSMVIPVALALAVADASGNSTLIEGVRAMRARAEAAGTPFQAPQMAWHDYYVDHPHLARIYVYAALLTIALALFLWSLRVWRRERALLVGEEAATIEADPDGDLAARRQSLAYRALRYLAGVAFCVAIIGNLAAVWSWRLERECKLAAHEMSIFYSGDEQCAGDAWP